MLRRGWESPHLAMGIVRFETLAREMEAALERSPWLAGESYTLADADFTPYLQRLEDLGLAWLWEARPALGAWYDCVRRRPSFAAVTEDWFDAKARQATAARAEEVGPKFRRILAAATA